MGAVGTTDGRMFWPACPTNPRRGEGSAGAHVCTGNLRLSPLQLSCCPCAGELQECVCHHGSVASLKGVNSHQRAFFSLLLLLPEFSHEDTGDPREQRAPWQGVQNGGRGRV